jgi:hypothetical protein
MNLATLRVEGADDSLESLKTAISLNIDAEWKKGDKRRGGLSHELSGFSTTVADASNPVELMQMVRAFLAQLNDKGIVISSASLEAELALGISVGDSEQFVAGIELSPSELLALGERGIALSIMAYPTSDEANAEENAT